MSVFAFTELTRLLRLNGLHDRINAHRVITLKELADGVGLGARQTRDVTKLKHTEREVEILQDYVERKLEETCISEKKKSNLLASLFCFNLRREVWVGI